MLEVDIEGGEVVDAQTMDLGDVVLVAGYSARRRSARECDILDVAVLVSRMLFRSDDARTPP